MTLFPATVKLIKEKTDKDILFIGGGIIPEKDVLRLKEAGIAQTFGPGTPLPEISKVIDAKIGSQKK
jgi:methylmalonyl-CoA mutase C-terminal domain/subunit